MAAVTGTYFTDSQGRATHTAPTAAVRRAPSRWGAIAAASPDNSATAIMTARAAGISGYTCVP